jgi:hypothetical protein
VTSLPLLFLDGLRSKNPIQGRGCLPPRAGQFKGRTEATLGEHYSAVKRHLYHQSCCPRIGQRVPVGPVFLKVATFLDLYDTLALLG